MAVLAADAERQGNHDGEGEARIAAQGAEGETEVAG